MQHDRERPLTIYQKGRLLFECVPFVFMLVATIAVLTIWQDLTYELTGQRYPFWLAPLLGLITAYLGWVAIQRVRDVVAGYAVVDEDCLVRLRRSRGTGGRSNCYAIFERLGRLRMWPSEFARTAAAFDLMELARLEQGSRPTSGPTSDEARFRVTYCPASRIALSAEPLPD